MFLHEELPKTNTLYLYGALFGFCSVVLQQLAAVETKLRSSSKPTKYNLVCRLHTRYYTYGQMLVVDEAELPSAKSMCNYCWLFDK